MAIRRFLAFMAEEIDGISGIPEDAAWMGLYYSPENGELCNLPSLFSKGCVLVLQDDHPFSVCDTENLCRQMTRAVSRHACAAVLLDFQTPPGDAAFSLAEALSAALPCPVLLPPALAGQLPGPVFLPPTPLDQPLREQLSPWAGREIWLELALDGSEIRLRESGAQSTYLPHARPFPQAHREPRLHCHYHIQTAPHQILFTLWRTREDVEALIKEAEALGVTGCVGLWQELG